MAAVEAAAPCGGGGGGKGAPMDDDDNNEEEEGRGESCAPGEPEAAATPLATNSEDEELALRPRGSAIALPLLLLDW